MVCLIIWGYSWDQQRSLIETDTSGEGSVFVVEAGVFGEAIFTKTEGLEIYNSSKGKWIGLSEEELKNSFRRNKKYRCQGFYYIFR
jgi:hypothetical protein